MSADGDGSDLTPGPLALLYAPSIVLVLATGGRAVLSALTLNSLSTLAFVGIAVTLSAAIVVGIAYLPSRPRPASVFAVAVLAWLVAALAGAVLLDPFTGVVDGAALVAADVTLVWVGAYSLAVALVYGINWTPVVAVCRRQLEPDTAE